MSGRLDLNRLARPSILTMQPYRSARSITPDARIFLDANESPDGDCNRYPSPQPQALVSRFAAIYGVGPDQILIGRGSDEAIDLLTRAFCEPGCDRIAITPPTYGMYEVSAAIQNAEVVRIPLLFTGNDWCLDTDGLIAAAGRSHSYIKIIYLCSPNNPTGATFPRDQIEALCEELRDQSLVVIDEAYGEFAPSNSMIPLMPDHPNLAVLRTLSKAWGLAGARCGTVLADPALISLLQKVRPPYPLPQPVIDLVLNATNDSGYARMRERVDRAINERERVSYELSRSPQVDAVYPSRANFLLVRFHDEIRALEACARHGIVLRSRSSEAGLERCVRITIGSRAENDQMLKALNEASAEART